MKKLALVLLLTALLSLTPNLAFAEDPYGGPFQIRKDNIEAKMDKTRDIKEEREENIKDRREEMKDKRLENISKYIAKLVSRFKAMSQRLQTLVERIESRLEKIATENPDVALTAIRVNLDLAKTNLADANSQIADLEATASDLVKTEDPKGTLTALRNKVNPIVKNLKGAHRVLVQVIGQIKGLRIGNTTNESK